jgi:fluoride exporter
MLERTLAVGAGGFMGASLRYLVGGLVHRWLGSSFPYGTFLVNVSGCFAIGVLAALVEERMLGPTARLFWMVGVLGGYTTFSSFGYETISLLREGSDAAAWANVLGQVALGLAAVWAGAAAGRALP